MKEHIKWIDSLKGFAMLCVVLGHVADGYLGGLVLTPGETYLIWGVFNVIYSFHMPLFMVISGLLFHQAYFDQQNGAYSKERIKKQSMNMVGVYVLFSVVFGLFKIAFSANVNKTVTVTDILMIWCKTIAPYWYLYVLIMLYCFFSWKVIYTKNENALLLLTAVMSLASIAVKESLFEINRFLYYTLFFYIGILYSKKRAHPLFSIPSVLALFILSLLCYAGFWNEDRNLNSIPVVNSVTALGIVLALMFLFEKVKMLENSAVFQIIGKNCLEVYVTHCFLTAGFRQILPKIGIQNVVVSMLLNCVLSTGIPIAAAMVMRQMKIHDVIFKPYSYISRRILSNRKCQN